jgi:hypothetical protein
MLKKSNKKTALKTTVFKAVLKIKNLNFSVFDLEK